jgi:hypothetical protein
MANEKTRFLGLDYDADARVNRNWDKIDQAVQTITNPPPAQQEEVTAPHAQIGNLVVTGNASVSGMLSADRLDVPAATFPLSVQDWITGEAMTRPTRIPEDALPLASLSVPEAQDCLALVMAEVTLMLRGSGLVGLVLARNATPRKVRRVPFDLHGGSLPYSAVILDALVGDADVSAGWVVEVTKLSGDLQLEAVFAQVSALVVR